MRTEVVLYFLVLKLHVGKGLSFCAVPLWHLTYRILAYDQSIGTKLIIWNNNIRHWHKLNIVNGDPSLVARFSTLQANKLGGFHLS